MTPQRSPDVPSSPKRRHHPRSTTASSAASGTQMPSNAGAVSLPDEIIFDILTRVPVNSACRFRCVSREWRALITDPDFVAAHKSRHAEPLIAVYSFREEPSKGIELRLVDIDGNVVRETKVADGGGPSKLPHHDLICARDDCPGAYLVDPATGEVLVSCACPRVSSLVMCFGRAVPSGAYKVVRLGGGERCQVLTLREVAGWRLMRNPPNHVMLYPGIATIVNGILHVLARVDMINCFDLESEEWTRTIEGPQNADLWWKTTNIVRVAELNNLLCMVQSEDRLINIWLLTDSENGAWVNAYRISKAPQTYFYMPLRMTHDGRRLLFQCSLYRRRAYAIRSYDAWTIRSYHAWTNTCTDVTETPGGLASKIGLCNLHLESFISKKI